MGEDTVAKQVKQHAQSPTHSKQKDQVSLMQSWCIFFLIEI